MFLNAPARGTTWMHHLTTNCAFAHWNEETKLPLVYPLLPLSGMLKHETSIWGVSLEWLPWLISSVEYTDQEQLDRPLFHVSSLRSITEEAWHTQSFTQWHFQNTQWYNVYKKSRIKIKMSWDNLENNTFCEKLYYHISMWKVIDKTILVLNISVGSIK